MKDHPPTSTDRPRLFTGPVLAIGIIGCVVLTASSVYTALKLGSLPWPTIFTSLVALALLRALGRRSLNEANVTQVVMSAGSMVAGGLAFTIPGVWMLGIAPEVSAWDMLWVTLAGTLLGLVCTALIRKKLVDDSDLEYPIGTAAATTLQASEAGGATGRRLLAVMSAAGIWAVARDVAHVIPSFLGYAQIGAATLGVQMSPMRVAVGFLAGRRAALWWAIGAVVGPIALGVAAPALGILAAGDAADVISSLGMGLMMGGGFGVVLRDVLVPVARRLAARGTAQGARRGGRPTRSRLFDAFSRRDAGCFAFMVALAALIISMALGIAPLGSAIIVALSFVTAIMSAQSVGQTGIDPMEIFGLIVMLIVAACAPTGQLHLFFIAGVISVACGLAGDVMSDFKTGQLIGTDPRQLWRAQALGALIGAVVSVAALSALLGAYGPGAFGGDNLFVAAQAQVVATMVGGIPQVPVFAAGIAAGAALYVAGVPAMMLGLGVYLPCYMTLTSVLGAALHVVLDALHARRAGARRAAGRDAAPDGADAPADDGDAAYRERGVIVASGLLGGESIVGMLIAFAAVASGMMG